MTVSNASFRRRYKTIGFLCIIVFSAFCAVLLFNGQALAAYETSSENVKQGFQQTLFANPNTSITSAKAISLNSNTVVAFDGNDDSDGAGKNNQTCHYWFKFKTSANQSVYRIRIATLDSGNCYYNCIDGNGKTLISRSWINHNGASKLNAPIQTKYFKLRGTKDKNKWMYVHLECTSYFNNCKNGDRFQIGISEKLILKKVTSLKASKRASTSISLKWGKQANAKKYQIRYRVKNGSWKTKTVIANTAKLKKLKRNKQYQVKVRAYNANGYNQNTDKPSSWGDWSKTITIKTKK